MLKKLQKLPDTCQKLRVQKTELQTSLVEVEEVAEGYEEDLHEISGQEDISSAIAERDAALEQAKELQRGLTNLKRSLSGSSLQSKEDKVMFWIVQFPFSRVVHRSNRWKLN